MPAPRVHIPNLDDLVQRYLDGEPASYLAREVGVSDTVIRNRLRERGVKIRPRTSYATDMEPAHAAARAKRYTEESLAERAARRHGHPGTSVHENMFRSIMHGVEFVEQCAVGKYSVDFVHEPSRVAVEVRGGGYTARARARFPEKVEHLLDRGLHVVVVDVRRNIGVTVGLREHLVPYLDRMGGQPAAPREYRVVRGDGQTPGPYRRKNDHRADVRRPVRGLD